MKNFVFIPFITLLLIGGLTTSNYFYENESGQQDINAQNGWISLFNGKNLNGWKASHPESFKVEDGCIVADGPRSHLYYVGSVENHNFKDFELKVDVMTKHHANSGIYFDTKFRKDGFPNKGFEVQINNSGSDWRRTGSLYSVVNISHKYVKDNEWFTMYIRVYGKNVIVKINGKEVINWTQPAAYVPPVKLQSHPGRYISSGTFALQEHTKGEVVYFKNIMVKPLP